MLERGSSVKQLLTRFPERRKGNKPITLPAICRWSNYRVIVEDASGISQRSLRRKYARKVDEKVNNLGCNEDRRYLPSGYCFENR